MVNLYNKIPVNAFYYVKSWINLDFDHKVQKDVSYDFDYTFYSPFVMDIEMTSIMYIFGKPIVVMQVKKFPLFFVQGVSVISTI